jgi:hypothetical protein
MSASIRSGVARTATRAISARERSCRGMRFSAIPNRISSAVSRNMSATAAEMTPGLDQAQDPHLFERIDKSFRLAPTPADPGNR